MGKKSAVAAIFLLAALLAAAQSTEGTEAEPAPQEVPASGSAPTPPPLAPVPVLPVEAPQSLLSLRMGDKDVELLAEGYWEVSVLASGAFGLGANEGVSAPTLLFRQIPDLWLSLTLLDRWFVEASLSSEGFGDQYVAGYRGGEGDFLREVRLGNKGVSFPDLPYLSLGAGSYTSFGISALGRSDRGSAHFLVRYDQARRITQTWVGSREVTRTEYRPSEYVRGRWFMLPDQGVSDVELYIESSSGTIIGSDTRKYRTMTADEYSLSAATGRVDLKTAVGEGRRLLVYYPGLNVLAITYDDGPPFYNEPPAGVTGVASGTALVLYERGEHEGFQIANRYALASSASAASAIAYVRDAATGLPDPAYTATVLSDGFARVTQTVAVTSAPDFSDYDFRMPFAGPPLTTIDVGMDWLYDPDAVEAAEGTPTEPAPAYSRVLVVETYGAPGSLVLEETGVLPGSVEVRRNGVLDYGFRYDPASNVVTLDRDPAISDIIEVSYLLASSDRNAGSLAAGLAGIFDLSPDWRAWTALGLRWGVPGTGYSEGGDAVPGSLTLTAGIRGGSPEPDAGPDAAGAPRFKAEAALAASYRRPDASGYYRLAGMEEASSWTSPFRPTGTWPAGVGVATVAAVADTAAPSLESLFPKLYGRFHSATSIQKVLQVSFAGHDGTTAEVVRYEEPVAVGDYRAFAFFARRDFDAAGAVLTVALDGADPAISVQVPAGEMVETWRRFVVRYDGVAKLYYQDTEDGPEHEIGVIPDPDPSVSAGRITISVTGVTDGSVFVDEFHFLDPAGEIALSGRGSFSWSRGGTLAESGAGAILSDPGFSARLSGTISEDSNFAGYLDGRIAVGPAKLAANLRQGYADGELSDGAFGHSLELPLKGFSVGDSFQFDSGSGRFGRRDFLSLQARGLGLDLEQSASYGGSVLEQAWKVRLAAGSWMTLGGELSNRAAGAVDLSSAYGEAWIEAFRYALPALEDASLRRTTTLTGAWKLGGGALTVAADSGLTDAVSPASAGSAGLNARLGWSIPAGRGSVEPYYRRVWTAGAVSQSSAFPEDWEFWIDRFSSSEYLYRTIPFAELFDPFTAGLFEAAAQGTTSSSYKPETGILFGRRYGSSWTDLVIPSKAALSLRRELASSLETVTDALVWEASASMAAVNLFGSRGTYRFSRLYSVDEYSQRFAFSLTSYRGDPDPLASFSHTALASFYTTREDNLVAENRLDLTESRDGLAWSERLSLNLTLRPSRTWLGDLVTLLLERSGSKPEPEEGTGPTLVSGFWDSLRTARGRLSEVWGASFLVKRPYAYQDRFDVELAQSYETKYVVSQKASLWARLGTRQTLNILEGADYWMLGFELTLGARVIF
ncbi:MAG TPA: hypothetical protein P5313_12725 [Spirochaetia bacterium]|nr:hypothetical protein [Spirochaetales bacterium]HRY81277.1 hypothetical protein [Spirochaetia bacterium]